VNLGELMISLQGFLDDRAHSSSIDMCNCEDCQREMRILYEEPVIGLLYHLF
jgi:hypothetical protein